MAAWGMVKETLISFTDLPKIQTLTPLKSQKMEVFETPLSAYQAGGESDI
jgi:hypothetical protein